MKEHGGDIYGQAVTADFSTNVNPLGMPEAVKQAAEEGVQDSGYYPDPLCRKLRTAISKAETVPAEWIRCGNGAAELIYSLVLAVKPRQAVIAVPSFLEYEQALYTSGCQVVRSVLTADKHFRVGEEIMSVLSEDIDMLFLCNPNNPTGLTIEKSLLDRILTCCETNHIILVIDECFNDWLAEPESHSLKNKLPAYRSLVVLKAFTKMYAMPGLRLGYLMSSYEQLLQEMDEQIQPWNVSQPAQYAGIAALEQNAYRDKSRKLIAEERKWLSEQLINLGLTVYPSEANYLFFQGRAGLKEQLLKHGILIRACSNYEGLGKGYYRIAVKLHKENEELIAVLTEVLQEG